jgi:hypothetical protein
MQRQKDPERVRLGRLGGLTCHAGGLTNVGPAREAWERRLAEEFGITDELDARTRQKRMDFALRVRMTELALRRWGNRKADPVAQITGTGQEDRGASHEPQPGA